MNRYANRAWAGLVLYVLAVEVLAPPDELMSHAYDRGMTRPAGRVVLPLVTAVTALHLLNVFDILGMNRFDPFAVAFRWKEKVNPQSRDNGVKPNLWVTEG